MEKENLYPEMSTYEHLQNAPPNYNQTYPEMMPSSAGVPPSGAMMQNIPIQGQQPQLQPITIQNIPPIPPLGPHPCLVSCPSCYQKKMTIVRPEAATKTHLFAAVLCLVGLCCCVCVPYFVDSCKNANHYCSNCGAFLGTYNK
ncbi:lipopolysaccharide-induced tumor necrosis factor-alpha factor homolog [Eupeodes corollae]|uniref:lipopolysaccharide-induced tumor necrosis factor-alpha factor homolog n=1 Tax=Eupeodes corollae TaxID=290404 RepID=UPI002493BDE5|nr:lipopolysaccharide-induced tumor necrosis factor-alpha factor homolog [Eupeodes corollae]